MERLPYETIIKHPEFVWQWDVWRDERKEPITVDCDYGQYNGPPLTDQQLMAVRHAVRVWANVCEVERSTQADYMVGPKGEVNWSIANVAKSRLLGRMIHDGLPPTRTKPPIMGGGPEWGLLPGGDPFVKYAPYSGEGLYIESNKLLRSYPVYICGRCGALVQDIGLHNGKCL